MSNECRPKRLAAAAGLLAAFAWPLPPPAAAGEADPLAEECNRPAWRATIPAGATADQQAMAAAQRAVRDFDRAVAAYGRCLADAEGKLGADPRSGAEDRQALAARRVALNDAAVSEAERVVARYNDELRAWRAARSEGGASAPASGGGELVAARLKQGVSQRDIDRCYPAELRRAAEDARLVVTVAIALDGSARLLAVPDGTPAHLAEAAGCVVEALRFEPARLEGRQVASQADLPLDFGIAGGADPGRIVPPALKSTDAELAALHAACYPPEFDGRGRVVLEITVSEAGEVVRTRVAESSGLRRVDAIARCILGKAAFHPARREGKGPVEVKLSWPVNVRP